METIEMTSKSQIGILKRNYEKQIEEKNKEIQHLQEAVEDSETALVELKDKLKKAGVSDDGPRVTSPGTNSLSKKLATLESELAELKKTNFEVERERDNAMKEIDRLRQQKNTPQVTPLVDTNKEKGKFSLFGR